MAVVDANLSSSLFSFHHVFVFLYHDVSEIRHGFVYHLVSVVVLCHRL